MNRFALLQDVKTRILACLGPDCTYKVAITRGRPPHECNQIGIWLGSDVADAFEDCGDLNCDVEHLFSITIELVRICAAPQASANFDFDREEAETECFLNDLDEIQCCLTDQSWNQVRRDHLITKISNPRTPIAQTTQGGAYWAQIVLEVEMSECCD